MLVKEIMTKNLLTTSPDETISHVLAKMRQHRVHQILVLDEGKLAGMVTANKIITREFDPTTTKVRAVMAPTPTIKPDFTMEEAAELMINSDVRALPVVDRELIGIVSENDILKHAKINASLDDVAKKCIYVNESDNVGKVKQIFVRNNLSRVPVMKNGKIIGVVGTLELITLLEGKQKFSARKADVVNRGYKEKMSLDKTPVATLMREPVLVRRQEGFAKALSLLKEGEEVIVTNGTSCIITPKDVLRLLQKPKKQAYYQISGMDGIDDFDAAKMQQTIDETIKKLGRMAELQPMNARIKQIKKRGTNIQYEIHAQLPTNIGTFVVSKVTGWNVVTAMQEAMKNLEKEVMKKYSKLKNSDRATKAYMRGK